MDPLLLIGGGAAALLLLSNAKQTTSFDDSLLAAPKSKKDFATNNPSWSTAASNAIENPTYDISDVQSYADWVWVKNALVSMGYDADAIAADPNGITAINSAVYNLSVNQWLNMLKVMVGKDPAAQLLGDSGAMGIIENRMIAYGIKKIAIGSGRNYLTNYNPALRQDSYIAGEGTITDFEIFGVSIQTIIDTVTFCVQFLNDIGFDWFQPDHDIANGVRDYLINEGMGSAAADEVAQYINYDRRYYDAGKAVHEYLRDGYGNNFLPGFKPQYLI